MERPSYKPPLVVYNLTMTTEDEFNDRLTPSRRMLGLREFFAWVTVAALAVGFAVTIGRLRRVEQELAGLRIETGYLTASDLGQIAAVRVPSDEPLTYRIRVRVPGRQSYRIAYSSLWPRSSATPQWFAAVAVRPGESLVTVRIHEDPRDDRWKITTLVRSDQGTKRVGTVLSPEQVQVFRGTHDVVSTGVGRETVVAPADQSIRILDERWLVGESSLLLYGNRPPEVDQLGVYAELQPDVGTL